MECTKSEQSNRAGYSLLYDIDDSNEILVFDVRELEAQTIGSQPRLHCLDLHHQRKRLRTDCSKSAPILSILLT